MKEVIILTIGILFTLGSSEGKTKRFNALRYSRGLRRKIRDGEIPTQEEKDRQELADIGQSGKGFSPVSDDFEIPNAPGGRQPF